MIHKSLFAILLSMCSVVVSAADGDLDITFTPSTGANDYVSSIAVQADGKIIIGGNFTEVGGEARNRIARLNADGSLDESFNPGIGANNYVSSIALQADGKIIIGGYFTAVDGEPRTSIARLNTDGTVDLSFFAHTEAAGYVWTVAVQADGKIFIAGKFSTVNGEIHRKIARLNADGSLDSSFKPDARADGYVYTSTVQPDGKILIGGAFAWVNGVLRPCIARLNADGSLDGSFNPDVQQGGYVFAIAVHADGRIVFGGSFTINVDIHHVARLNADGSLDLSFDSGTSVSTTALYAIAVQADGKIIIGGNFTAMNGVPRNYIARLRSDGFIDLSFHPGNGANGEVSAIAVKKDGKVIIGGYFTTVDDIDRNYVASVLASSDVDIDGMPDHIDTDDDNDGVADTVDKFPLDASRWQVVRHNTDADNDSDLLTRSSSAGTWTRHTIQNAAITGTGSMNAYTSSGVQYVAQLDANGDGDADILTRNTSTGAWYLHQVQNGAVTTTAPIYLYASLDQQFIGAGDFNNDGTDDVMLRSTSGGYYTVFLLSNHGVSSTVFYNAWTSSASVPQGVGDFDGDGTDDLLVRRTSDNLYFIFKTTNGGTVNNYCVCNLWNNPHWTFQFAGDTNKDGTDDIVIRGTGASADGKWWNFRMNNFSSTQTTNLNTFLNKTQVSFAASGDYNGDGHTDMLIRVNNGPVYVARIVNGVVSGSTTLLSNLPADQVVLK